jgi:hypothetical protein
MLPRLRCCLVAEGRQVFGCPTAPSILPLGLHGPRGEG